MIPFENKKNITQTDIWKKQKKKPKNRKYLMFIGIKKA